MDIPPEAQRRIDADQVAWLTTVSDRGAPTPNPVWFIADGDQLVVYSEPTSRKVHNIEQRPLVSLHFNSDADGGDVVVVAGRAELTPAQKLSSQPGYLDKYEAGFRALDMDIGVADATYSTRITITPTKVRLTAG